MIGSIHGTSSGTEALTPRTRPRLFRGLALAVAFGIVAVMTIVWALGQSRFSGAVPTGVSGTSWELIALSVLGIAALVVAGTVEERFATVGLVTVGTFAVLGGIVENAFLPAVGMVLLGGGVATITLLPRDRIRETGVAWATALLLLGATAASLVGAIGVEPATLRPLGGVLLFLGLLAFPLWTGVGAIDAAVGTFVAAFLAGIGLQAPALTGAVLLSGLSVVGVPLLLVAIGAGAAVAAIASLVRRSRYTPALGGGLVLVAGVPTSLAAAAAVVLGVVAISLRGGEDV